MEKKMILLGLSRRDMAADFLKAVIDSLRRSSVNITHIDIIRYRLDTPHTETWFVFPSDRVDMLDGIMADAIFGSQYETLLYRAKSDAVIACRDRIGLVEYICQVERESAMPKLLITTAGSDTSEFYKRLINSVYGAFPKNRSPFVALDTDTVSEVKFLLKGRGNGKTQACIDYMRKLIEKGEISMDAANLYIKNDITMTRGAATLASVMTEINDRKKRNKLPGIKNVIYSGPCTIVLWEDGTKTVVRCNNDVLDPEKGLAMAIAKKALGTNKSGSNYYDIFKKYLPKPEVEEEKKDG